MDYLVGKYIKATKWISLAYRVVDDQLCSSSSIYIPEIFKGNYFKVINVDKDIVTLQNLNSNDWSTCELTLFDIEDFKVVSRESVLDNL